MFGKLNRVNLCKGKRNLFEFKSEEFELNGVLFSWVLPCIHFLLSGINYFYSTITTSTESLNDQVKITTLGSVYYYLGFCQSFLRWMRITLNDV